MFGRRHNEDVEPEGAGLEDAGREGAGAGSVEPASVKRRPWWWRLGSLVLEIGIVVALAAAIPPALSELLHTQYPLAAITSSSMWPALERGDLVVVKGLNGGTVAPGQIIVYRNAEDATMVIHRVLTVDGTEIVTKGDANNQPDDPITLADVTGVVPMLGDSPLHLPYLGRITLAANDRY